MRTLKIADFCETGSGGTPSRARASEFYDNGVIPWVKSGELAFGEVNYTEEKITEAALANSSAKLIAPGSLLIAMYGATVGQVARLRIAAATNQAVCHIKPDENACSPEYLYWYLRSSKESLLKQRVGGAQPNISQGIIRDMKVPLPPLAEQERIAGILDKADGVRRKREEALKLSDELLRSVFLEMFGDPVTNGWRMKPLAELIDAELGSIRTGPFGSQLLHSEFVETGIAVLGIDNAVTNQFKWGKLRFIDESKYEQLKRYTVYPGDVIITIMGTVGRCAIVPSDVPKAINTKHLCCITLDREKCLPEFLHAYFLTHPIARQYLAKTSKGAIMDGLNMGIIKAMPVPHVPIKVQKKFQQFFFKRNAIQGELLKHKEEGNCLFSSLQQRAFSGQL